MTSVWYKGGLRFECARCGSCCKSHGEYAFTYLSDEDVRAEEDPQFQGSEWLAIRPRLKSAPVVIPPGPFHADATGME